MAFHEINGESVDQKPIERKTDFHRLNYNPTSSADLIEILSLINDKNDNETVSNKLRQASNLLIEVADELDKRN